MDTTVKNNDGYTGDYCIYIADYGKNVELVKEIIQQHVYIARSSEPDNLAGKMIAIGCGFIFGSKFCKALTEAGATAYLWRISGEYGVRMDNFTAKSPFHMLALYSSDSRFGGEHPETRPRELKRGGVIYTGLSKEYAEQYSKALNAEGSQTVVIDGKPERYYPVPNPVIEDGHEELAAELYKQALILLKYGDRGAATAKMLEAAQYGNGYAQNYMGEKCTTGSNMANTYINHSTHTQAVKWFNLAAVQNVPEAEYNLAMCYTYGDGVRQNREKALELFAKAAEQGHTKAKEMYGQLTNQTGDDVVIIKKQLSAFPVGDKNDGFAQYFTGQSYLAPLSTEQVSVYNVTFEPACRNNWHVHHAKSGGGQMLICVAGRGWYQQWGQAPRELHPGDVVNIPQGVKHWHGAAKDCWFQHLAVEVPGEGCHTEWCEPVNDEQYKKLV